MAEEPESTVGASEDAETNTASARVPPYIPFSTFLTFLSELKTNGLPPQIDNSVLKRFAGGTQGQLKSGMRALGLLDGSKPTKRLEDILNAYETPEFEGKLLDLLKVNYPYIFALDLMSATPQMFADSFKVTGAKEDVSRKCRTFFLNAAKRANVPLGQRILSDSVPRSPTNGPARRRKAPKAQSETPAPKGEETPAPKAKTPEEPALHPLVQGLLVTLPSPGEKWAADARASWLRMAAFIFENIYQGAAKGSIDVKVKESGD